MVLLPITAKPLENLGKNMMTLVKYWYVLVTRLLWMNGRPVPHKQKSILKARENAMIIVRLRSNSRALARITLLPARRSVVACYYQGNGGQKHPGIFRIRGKFRGFCGPYAWRNHLWLGQIHTNSWIQALNASSWSQYHQTWMVQTVQTRIPKHTLYQPWLEHPSLKDDLPPGETGNDLRLRPI